MSLPVIDLGALQQAVMAAMQSQLFQGGAAIAAVTALVHQGRALPMKLWGLISRRFIVQIDIMSNDALFGWFSAWLDELPSIKKSRLITATTYWPEGRYTDNGQNAPVVLFTPAPGRHLVWFNRRPIFLVRERKEPKEDGGPMRVHETFTLRTLGWDSTAMRGLLVEACDKANADRTKVSIYGLRQGDWNELTNIKPRSITSVFLRAGQLERIIADLEEFLAREDWYGERGIPWRRGHLYEGPPGSGKSSIVAALSGHFHLNLYLAPLSDKLLTDEKLLGCLQDVLPRSIVLLEDVDALVQNRDMKTDNGVSFAGLLNALDGVASKAGVITIMTTNHPDKLDPALIRNGRVDLREHFGVASEEQARRLFLHFYRGIEVAEEWASQFAAYAEGHPMAQLQGLLVDSKDLPMGAASAVTNLPAPTSVKALA